MSAPELTPASALTLDAQGSWHHDGDRVRHHRLSLLLHRSVARDDEGALIVTTGRDALPFTPEDAPLFVLTVDEAQGEPLLVLADERRVPFTDAEAITIDDEGRVRLRLPLPRGEGRGWALLLRPAAQWVAHRLEEPHEHDAVALLRAGKHARAVNAAPAHADWTR